jgi:hypothetical protein
MVHSYRTIRGMGYGTSFTRLRHHDGGSPSSKPIAGGRRQQASEEKVQGLPDRHFHIDIAELQTTEGKLYLHVAIDLNRPRIAGGWLV